ncbi:MAG: NAD(P)-dependent oxidoreductase [Bacteroidota bacterium]
MKRVIAFFETTRREERFLKSQLGKDFHLTFVRDTVSTRGVDSALDAHILSVFIYSKITKEVLKELRRLQFINTRSTGFNHIDIQAARARKILVSNVPYYGENTVAEHTFGLILSLSRKIHKAYVRTVQSNFSAEGLQGFDLKGKTLGVIGAGSIGLHVIKMAKGFGMRVIAYDVKQNHFLAETLDFQYVSFKDLLKGSDIITLHCPYNENTHHLINMKNIHLVKKGTLFINTARGGLIETKALHYALDRGIFDGAGLDVFEGEELAKEENQMLSKNVSVEKLQAMLQRNILLRRENVIITPHIAFDSVEAVERILQTTCDNILNFVNGTPTNVVS